MNQNSLLPLTNYDKKGIILKVNGGSFFMQRLKDDVRKSIITSSKKLFIEKGFNETSISDIAKNAGISTGNIYRYFLTKQKILDEILSEIEKELIEFLDMLTNSYSLDIHETTYNELFEKMISLSNEKNEELNILFKCENQVQFIVFKQKMLDIFLKKINIILKSLNFDANIDSTLCSALSIAVFNGILQIIKDNSGNTDKMRENLYKFKSIVIDKIDQKILEMAKS